MQAIDLGLVMLVEKLQETYNEVIYEAGGDQVSEEELEDRLSDCYENATQGRLRTFRLFHGCD